MVQTRRKEARRGPLGQSPEPAPHTDMSIQGEPDERDKRYLKFVMGRLYGVDDETTAQTLGCSSARALYEKISADRHPICPTCGKTYVGKDHCKPSGRRESRKFRPKSWNEATKLPPAEEAIDLLRWPLEHFGRELESLRGREEYLQNKRFVGEVRDGDGTRKALGAWQAPPEPLTTLVALYALWAGSANTPLMWRLLRRLHPSEQIEVREPLGRGTSRSMRPDPDKIDMEELEKRVRALRTAAVQVARMVRGREIREGRPTGDLAPRHHAVAEAVGEFTRQGLSDEEIAEEVNKRYAFGPFEDAFTAEEIRWIRELGVNAPD